MVNIFFGVEYYGKKQIEIWFSVVCTLIDNPYGPPRAFIVKLLGKSLMRAVCISASRAAKSRTALLGTHIR